jgi:NAD(P)-dependent dehydrogenase (short-subunit alcohol dehydrogenase family)
MITEGFVANGAKVYICSRKKETIQSTADALTKRGTLPTNPLRLGPGTCIAIQADLSSYEGCVGLAQDLTSREKCISIV